MAVIKYGCQSYPWKMNQAKFEGRLDHIVKTTAQAGFQGLEAELCMLGDYFEDPIRTKQLFDEYGIQLVALVFHQSCKQSRQSDEESMLLSKTLDFLTYFPGSRLMVSHQAKPGDRAQDPEILRKNRECLMRCLAQIADRAGERGFITAFHPNSSVNSLFRVREDYLLMFDMLAKTDMGYAPDIGHIVNGGMDPMEILRMSRNKIRHVHFKDRNEDGRWAVMGEGAIDYPEIIRYLEETGYAGWIMVEDESEKAESDSDAVVRADGLYVSKYIKK